MISNRRDFLKLMGFTFGSAALFTSVGFIPTPRKLIRPPGGQKEQDFLSKCIKCQQCINACPEKALRPAQLSDGLSKIGTPVLFSTCTLCLDCVKTCPTGALTKDTTLDNAKMAIARVIPDECIGCDKCIPACQFEAISSWKEKKLIKIDEDKCKGCFACVVACPVVPVGVEVVPL